MSQQQISKIMERLDIDWTTASVDEVRVAYIRHLRVVAAGHESGDGTSLVGERILTERVDREMKQLMLDEKKGYLVNPTQLMDEIKQMCIAFREELLARDNKLKSELDAMYLLNIDIALLNEFTYAAISQFGKYSPDTHTFEPENK